MQQKKSTISAINWLKQVGEKTMVASFGVHQNVIFFQILFLQQSLREKSSHKLKVVIPLTESERNLNQLFKAMKIAIWMRVNLWDRLSDEVL